MNLRNNTPILVGAGSLSQESINIESPKSRYDILAEAAELAILDAGPYKIKCEIDTLVVIRSHADTSFRFNHQFGKSTNPPGSVAKRLKITPSRSIYTWYSGNMPQYSVNRIAELVSNGEVRMALIAGGEVLKTQRIAQKSLACLNWAEDPGGCYETWGDPRAGCSDHESNHGLNSAIAIYPLIENAIRRSRGASIDEHIQSMAALMSKFSRVASQNSNASRREFYSPERLAKIDNENFWVSFPYPKLMMANAYTDHAGAFVITSAGVADELGIPRENWIYLHGYADAKDTWSITERYDLSSSLAINLAAKSALEMAKLSLSDIELIDLYSCFPSAVEVACKELGLSEDDPRNLTVTGGLPYFGGIGNSYAVLSICEMIKSLRNKPGKFGLIYANGNWITKHSFGIYSTREVAGKWQANDCADIQKEVDSQKIPHFIENPRGAARVVTYGVNFEGGKIASVIIMGELIDGQYRFIANIDDRYLNFDVKHDLLDLTGTVMRIGNKNIFTPLNQFQSI